MTTMMPSAWRAPPEGATLDGAGRSNRALFPRQNFTNLIDRSKRTREIIDFLLRRSRLLLLWRSLFLAGWDGDDAPARRAAIDRVRTQRENLHCEVHNLCHQAK